MSDIRNRDTEPPSPMPRRAVTIRLVLDLSYELQPEHIEVQNLERGLLDVIDALSGSFAPLEKQGALVGLAGLSASIDPETTMPIEQLEATMLRAGMTAYQRAAEHCSFREELARAVAPAVMELAAGPVRKVNTTA